MYTVSVQEGVLADASKLLRKLPYSKLEFEARKLGAGARGEVYRIIPKKFPNQSFVVKLTDTDQAMNDLVVFQILADVAQGQSSVIIPKVKVLKLPESAMQSLDATAVMQLEDVRGQTLFSWLNDSKVLDAEKEWVIEKYESFLEHIESQLQSKYGMVTFVKKPQPVFFPSQISKLTPLAQKQLMVKRQPRVFFADVDVNDFFSTRPALFKKVNDISGNRTLQWMNDSKRDEIEMILKSDNFIVTPNLDLYLIDPY